MADIKKINFFMQAIVTSVAKILAGVIFWLDDIRDGEEKILAALVLIGSFGIPFSLILRNGVQHKVEAHVKVWIAYQSFVIVAQIMLLAISAYHTIAYGIFRKLSVILAFIIMEGVLLMAIVDWIDTASNLSAGENVGSLQVIDTPPRVDETAESKVKN